SKKRPDGPEVIPTPEVSNGSALTPRVDSRAMGAARGPGGDIVASAIGARTVRIATSTRRVETGVSALPPLLLPLIIRTPLLDGPLGLNTMFFWGLEFLLSVLILRL